MKAKKFYKEDLPKYILDMFDDNYNKNYSEMVHSVSNDNWNQDQQKTQKKFIIPLIAIYKTFIDLGVEEGRAFDLTKKWSENRARSANRIVKTFFKLPNFKKLFFRIFKKRMATPGIWDNEIITENNKEFTVDITKCLWKETCDYFSYPELCKIFCDNDWIVFGNLKKMHLEREGTLGLGAEKCDFKFVFNNEKTVHK